MINYFKREAAAPNGDTELPTVEAPKLAVAEGAAATNASPVLADSERTKRFALLAGAVAIAAAAGAMAGAFGASGLMWAAEVAEAAPMPSMVDETRALQSAITQLQTDLAALKTGIEAGAKSTNGQLAKIAERLDRIDRPQAARETTGSVTPPQPIVDGWIVRNVYRGTALIQGRGFGMIEVEPGDTLPGIGRVEAIRRQDGRWVVVTSRGLIPSAR